MRKTLALLAGLSLAAVLSGCGSSGPDDKQAQVVDTDDGSSTSHAAVQETLDSVADQLRRFSDRDGYGGLAYDLGSKSIDLWWKGELDPDAKATLDKVRSGDVTVNVHAANFSRSELGSASNRIAGTKADDGSYEVQSVVLEDLRRPTFVYGLVVDAKLGPGATKDDVESTLSRIAGVPVTLSDLGMPQD